MVPRNEKPLVPMPAERVRLFREHLDRELADLRKAKHPERMAKPVCPEPTGFAARVVQAACTLCKGFCCRNGGDHAFLGDWTLAGARRDNPGLTDEALRQLYLDRVPPASYRGSCIFHGERGCTLDRSMRADVCNRYFCGGLGHYLELHDPAGPTVVIAGEAKKMRTSPVLVP